MSCSPKVPKKVKGPPRKRSKLGALGRKFGLQVVAIQKKMNKSMRDACADATAEEAADFIVGLSAAAPREIRASLAGAMVNAVVADDEHGHAARMMREAVSIAVARLAAGEEP